jgi:cation-transporting ATPase 13A1
LSSDSDPKKLVPVTETGKNTTLALAAAHALVLLDDGTVVGDPMEKTTLTALDWKLSRGELASLFAWTGNEEWLTAR